MDDTQDWAIVSDNVLTHYASSVWLLLMPVILVGRLFSLTSLISAYKGTFISSDVLVIAHMVLDIAMVIMPVIIFSSVLYAGNTFNGGVCTLATWSFLTIMMGQIAVINFTAMDRVREMKEAVAEVRSSQSQAFRTGILVTSYVIALAGCILVFLMLASDNSQAQTKVCNFLSFDLESPEIAGCVSFYIGLNVVLAFVFLPMVSKHTQTFVDKARSRNIPAIVVLDEDEMQVDFSPASSTYSRARVKLAQDLCRMTWAVMIIHCLYAIGTMTANIVGLVNGELDVWVYVCVICVWYFNALAYPLLLCAFSRRYCKAHRMGGRRLVNYIFCRRYDAGYA